MILDTFEKKRLIVFSILVLFCGLLVPGLEILDPDLGIIGILISVMVINGFVNKIPIKQGLPLLFLAALIVSIVNYSVLRISCLTKPLQICEWNYLFFSFFYGGLLLLFYALDRLILFSSKRMM